MSNDTESFEEARPVYYIGQHDSSRDEPLTDLQYGQVLNLGVSRQRRKAKILVSLYSWPELLIASLVQLCHVANHKQPLPRSHQGTRGDQH